MTGTAWQLFICFFVFVFPVFGAIGGSDSSVSWLSPMLLTVVGGVLWLLFLAYLAWLFVIRTKRLVKQMMALQLSGRAVKAEIVELFPEATGNYAIGVETRFSFTNLSGTKVTVPFVHPQAKGGKLGLKKGQQFTLYLNPELKAPPFASQALPQAVMKEQRGYYLFVFSLVYFLLTIFLWFFVFDHQLTMRPTHPWFVTPILGLVSIHLLSRYFNYNAELLKPKTIQLMLVGKSAQAEVLQVHETSIERGESSEVSFTLRFIDDRGQTHTVRKKQLLQSTEVHKAYESTRELIYLPDEPQVVAFADALARAHG